MRRILPGDLQAAARVVLAAPAAARPAVVDRMLQEAHFAHHYTKRFGRAHPVWGNGSLLARAAVLPQRQEPCWADPAYLDAIALTIQRLLHWYGRRDPA